MILITLSVYMCVCIHVSIPGVVWWYYSVRDHGSGTQSGYTGVCDRWCRRGAQRWSHMYVPNLCYLPSTITINLVIDVILYQNNQIKIEKALLAKIIMILNQWNFWQKLPIVTSNLF